jgi:glutamine synthetase
MKTASSAHILDRIRQSEHHRIKVAVSDIDGILRGKYLHKDKFLSAADSGFGFCNVVFGWDCNDTCYDNVAYTGWHTGYPDAVARIDLNTIRSVPWDGSVPFFLGDFVDGAGAPLPICPRQLLKRMIDRLRQAGYTAKFGLEFEWFNFKETPQSLAEKQHVAPAPLSPGMFGYSLIRMHQNQPYFTALIEELAAFDLPLEGLHTETGPGVFEAAILYSDALEAADRAVLFKSAVKDIASRFGIVPSFMAKWNATLPGCSGHSHQSLWPLDGSVNLFYDERDPHKMSALFRSYLAGMLRCLPEILPMFAPTVNSYKRLVDGYWAPTKPTWGIDNRTVAFRVIPGGAKSTRLEARVPGSDINPYLAVAACIAAGLYGIENKLTLDAPPVVGSAYLVDGIERLPRDLGEATRRMAESKIARQLFGDAFVEHYVATRQWEWRQYQNAVTNWELQRYFEVI